MAEIEYTSDLISRLVVEWEQSVTRLDRAKASVLEAEDKWRKAQDDLGKALTPKNAKPGSFFQIWVRRTPKGEDDVLHIWYGEQRAHDGIYVDMVPFWEVRWWNPE